MAVVSLSSSSPFLSPLLFTNPAAPSSAHPNLPLFTATNRPRPLSIVFSYKSRSDLSSEDKKILLERYGLDPHDLLFEPPPPPKSKRTKEVQKRGRGKEVQPPEEPKPPRTTHKLLQVLGGKARRKKLLSPKGMDVRPMMVVVKGAAFDILQVHFVEMDPWVVSDVLRPNLECTGFLDVSVIHTVRVENFLERAEQFVGKGGSFDYISVTPPYTEVDYGMLMGQISKSPLIGEDTFVVVEYPSRTNMLDSCGCLVKITERRFGRTHLVIYGPRWAQKNRK
ncbi:uncharacterized protein LOC142623338 isoform X2 [Castanea sativa]|uniref:uncharacterized protein LOC142623338 isoform X2 n=1 Tax=Castanea sativa TaxID=21020 RepID=UPI003F6518CE